MKKFTLRIIYDRKNETAKDATKKAPVSIEVREVGTSSRKLISTGVKLTKDQYSYQDGKGLTIKNHSNAMILRHTIINMYNGIESFIHSRRCKNLDDVNNWYKTDEELRREDNGTFINFFNEQMKIHASTDHIFKSWNALFVRLNEFGKIQSFEDLTYSNIEELDFFLKKTIKSQPTLYKRHTLLKRVIELAVKKGIISALDNPYNHFKINMGKSAEPTTLEMKELKAIEDYVPITEIAEKIKDMYLFQVYTGVAFVDMQSFSKDDVIEVGEYLMIKSARHKTDVNYVTLFTDESKAIAEKYDYTLPQLTNAHYNRQLKVMAKEVGINKNLTSHTARHTFATNCLNKGLDIVIVSKALGHTSLKQTQRYARLLPETIAQQMSKALKK